jgi:nucleoside-triphosphatase THEP1
MSKRLIIISAPVGVGKTTALLKWIADRKDVGGVLTPDIDSLRKILRLRDRKLFEFQLDGNTSQLVPTVQVGRFTFLASSFELISNILLEDMKANMDFVVVDELGKLEINGEGLSKCIRELMRLFRGENNRSNLIIIIRDYLLEEAMELYDLKDSEIIELGGTNKMNINIEL